MDNESAIEKACRIVGAAELARQCGVKPQAVDKWKRRVPAERVRAIVAAVKSKGGDVRPSDLRPDLYPSGFEFESFEPSVAERFGAIGRFGCPKCGPEEDAAGVRWENDR